jgi:hypothetical protein
MACISTQIFTGYSLWSHGIASTGSETETEVVNPAPTSSDFIRIEA